mgnify:CR=1 FL=1|jgi:outer membrane receptor for ferrienterochelin and colicins
MKKKLIFIDVLFLQAVAVQAVPCLRQQESHVLGVVLTLNPEGEREAVPFATVYWLESGTYADCDGDGKFRIARDDGRDRTLVTAALGYRRDTMAVADDVEYVEVFLRSDSELDEAVVVARSDANYLLRSSSVRTEVISSAGLNKMACCNLAESFENSASVSVGYSDAVTGARQIRLLGLSGIYTAMLDENRPVMRGLAAPFGLSYIPGQWLESIQIAKGPSSVINGVEAISGQINVEHRKPTDEKPLFLNAFVNSMLMGELNAASSLQIGSKWSTVLMAHASHSFMDHDMNGDGFRDEPRTTHLNIANRWLYYDESGVQVRFGVKALYDSRIGGQMSFGRNQVDSLRTMNVPWGTSITNRGVNGYLKVGVPLNADNSRNIAVVADYTYHQFDSYFGLKSFFGKQNSGFLNIMYQDIPNDSHRFTFGVRDFFDGYGQILHDGYVDPLSSSGQAVFTDFDFSRRENSLGVYGEYTYTLGEKFSLVADLSLDWNSLYGLFLSPRANLKWAPADWLVIRASGGRGTRSPNVVVDNLGMMSTGRRLDIAPDLGMESAWTYGGNITFYIPIGFEDNSYLSIDYFRSDFTSQIIVDQEYDWSAVSIYSLDGPSYTNTWQADFSVEPFERFTILATFRYSDSKVWLKDRGLVERPLVSRYKGVLNLQYATRMNIWTFDFTAQINGPARLPDFAVRPGESGMSPVYPVLFAQITRKFKGVDVYVGVENITNYRQEHPIIGAENPWSPDFNASVIWGPLTGVTAYAGVRFTLWK